MKTASEQLINFLASNNSETMKIADLYTISLKNGTTLRYTSADFDINYGGYLYSCNNAALRRSEISWQIGLSVDDLTIEFNPSPDDLINTIPMVEAFRNGTFDNADFRLDFAFYNQGWENEPLVLEKIFVGTLDVEEITGSYVKISVKSPMELLTCDFPSNCYQSSCHYTLYGVGCGVNKNDYSEKQKLIAQNSSKHKIYCTLSKPSGYYNNGIIEFIDGKNVGAKRAVKLHENGVLTLSTPLLYEPLAGEKFNIYAGCNKSLAMCKKKFNNGVNFGGTPFVPAADNAL